jgi:hypothetical protein
MKYLLIMYMAFTGSAGDHSHVEHDIMPSKQWCESAGKSYAGQRIATPNFKIGYFCVPLDANANPTPRP